MLLFAEGSASRSISDKEIKAYVNEVLQKLGFRKRVLVIPPDFTRFHSMAGKITQAVYEFYVDRLAAILPALGTHAPMTEGERQRMFGNIPSSLFHVHHWKSDLVTLGEVPSSFILEVSEGKLDYSWPAQVNRMITEGGFDLVLSIGQVVPHEVVGMANYNKNIFVGTGGREGINKSHFLGAVYGMERMMGHVDTPVRKVLNYASEKFLQNIPLVYLHTVIGKDTAGRLHIRGLFAGDDEECFTRAAKLSIEVNFEVLDRPLQNVVVYLDPSEYKSTWLGNKSIYRTRMALANGGTLIVLAPGLKEFGEDAEIDRLIRKYGYVGTPRVLELTRGNADLAANLSAAAHLIHGSTENRFRVIYCPGNLTRHETESVNFEYGPIEEMVKRYNPSKLKDGFQLMPDGEEIFYISNPALGLWASRSRLGNNI